MERVLLIARNTLRGVMSRKVIYIWGAAILLMFLRSSPALFMRNPNEAMMAYVRANAITGSLDMWGYLCIAAAMFLGAGSIPSEVSTRTIVTVLARPIRRWELLLGKWIGISAFCILTLAIGVALALFLARYLGINVSWRPLGYAALGTSAAVVLFGGVALVLSSFGSAGVAGALTVLLAFMPTLINVLIDDPGRIRHGTGVVLDYLVPPQYGSSYASVAWAPFPVMPNFRGPQPSRQQPVMDYDAERTRAWQSLAYGSVYFGIGCALFSRRDVKLG